MTVPQKASFFYDKSVHDIARPKSSLEAEDWMSGLGTDPIFPHPKKPWPSNNGI